MTRHIKLGISTCPNDTFTFHALIHQLVDLRGLTFSVELLDIQQLNDRLFRGEFDVAKTSFHAALHLADRTMVLPSGSALGYKVGPLLLASRDSTVPQDVSQVTLCPGELTTATMLFQLFYPDTSQLQHTLFSDIMPALQQHRADFGVCIHEGRFTWQAEGLTLVADLGTMWEDATHCPLPLGGIVAERRLGSELIGRVQAVIRDSLLWAQSHRQETLPTLRQYAQEFDDTILMQHVDLYVNDWTVDLGQTGQQALDELGRRAVRSGLLNANAERLEVWR